MRGALLVLALASLARAGDEPPLVESLAFDHDVHAPALKTAGLTCTDCHPIGLSGQPSGVETLAPSWTSCHECHRPRGRGAPAGAPASCTLCHLPSDALVPADHVADWRADHARSARARGATCRDCHVDSWCFACHDDRGPMSESPHDLGFRSFHGVEARLDPHACATCHTGATCVSCHETRSLPW